MSRKKAQDIHFGYPELDYAASDKFRARGMRENDTIFLVSAQEGRLYLGGYLKVANIVDKRDAMKALSREESEHWPANDYVIASNSDICRFHPKLHVPDPVVDNIWLIDSKHGQSNPKRTRSGAVDPQTFRALRELVPGEDAKLMALLSP